MSNESAGRAHRVGSPPRGRQAVDASRIPRNYLKTEVPKIVHNESTQHVRSRTHTLPRHWLGTEKRELEDERKGLEVTMKGVEDSSAAAQAILYEGGNGDLMKQVMMMMAEMKATLAEVRQE